MFRNPFPRLKGPGIRRANCPGRAFYPRRNVLAQKPQVVSAANAPLSLSLTADANIVSACDNGGAPQVQLNANAVSPGGNPIKYKWTTTDGMISGEGPVVTWNLAGLKARLSQSITRYSERRQRRIVPGVFFHQRARESVCRKSGRFARQSRFHVRRTSRSINRSTFTSRYSGGVPANVTPVYNWTVSAGTIIEGQGTDTIKVDTKGLAGQTVRASLSMGGYNLECSADCACHDSAAEDRQPQV